MNRKLLIRFLHEYPFQPATALWRAIEVDELVAHGLPDGRGLDLGCGDGLLTRIVLQEVGGRELVGVDPDPAEVEQARALGIYAGVHVAGGDKVPETDASFDWALSNSVLEHIPDVDPVLAEVARLVRRGGKFIFNVPGPGFHACLRGPLMPGASREEYLRHLDERLAHRRYWGPAEWEPALARHDMRLSDATAYLDAAEARRWESISRLTAGVLYGLAGRRRQPIEIQRRLGMRKSGRRLPTRLAGPLAAILGAGLNGGAVRAAPKHGACLITAVRL
ncbi:MAG: methyltransferase type 12 [Chloroflexi bacterium 13_1_40CM_2_68_14]|nr:MAG: methyltransferase type 12 [Chloroflexi bacterium 13_1_40CM_2_68_14]